MQQHYWIIDNPAKCLFCGADYATSEEATHGMCPNRTDTDLDDRSLRDLEILNLVSTHLGEKHESR